MATPRRRTANSLIAKLLQDPQRFEFQQAVRLLEQFAVRLSQQHQQIAHEPVGLDTAPALEAIRFRATPHLRFPATPVSGLKSIEREDGNYLRHQFELSVSFIGLLGSQGVLPYHYSEALIQRLRLRDPTMRDFIDLFHHRIVSLYYQVGQKYHFPIQYERHQLQKKPRYNWDLFSQTLRSLVGLGTPNLDDRLSLDDDPILFYAGHFAQRTRNATSLSQMIGGYFGISAKIEQFIGQWQDMMADFRTRLPGTFNRGTNHCLGQNTLLGEKCWQVQSKFRVRLEVKDYEDFMTLSPHSEKMRAMKQLIRLYVGIELDFDILIRVPRHVLPPCQLGKQPGQMANLGWNSYMPSTANNTQPTEDYIDVKISCQDTLFA